MSCACLSVLEKIEKEKKMLGEANFFYNFFQGVFLVVVVAEG